MISLRYNSGFGICLLILLFFFSLFPRIFFSAGTEGVGSCSLLLIVLYFEPQRNSTTLDDMKKIWLSRKFSYIYEAKPTANLGFFMQSLYAHSIGIFVSDFYMFVINLLHW